MRPWLAAVATAAAAALASPAGAQTSGSVAAVTVRWRVHTQLDATQGVACSDVSLVLAGAVQRALPVATRVGGSCAAASTAEAAGVGTPALQHVLRCFLGDATLFGLELDPHGTLRVLRVETGTRGGPHGPSVTRHRATVSHVPLPRGATLTVDAAGLVDDVP